MKLPKITDNIGLATPAGKFDIRFGPLDYGKCLLLAAWESETQDEKGWVRVGKPTATWWRCWKIRKKALFAAGLSPLSTDDGFRVRWRSKVPFPPLAARIPIPEPGRGKARLLKPGKGIRKRAGLLKHQPAAVAAHCAAILAHGGTLDASTTGVGKTFIALAVARELGLRPMVICPKNIIGGWEEAAKALGVDTVFISNYEQLKVGNLAPFVRKLPGNVFSWTLAGTNKVMAIFDEAHRLKSQLSQNSALAIGARAAGLPTMQLSATIAQDPTEMYTTGLLLNLHRGGKDFHRWAEEYGCAFDGMGLTYCGTAEDMLRLHDDLFPEHGSRIRSSDIPGFPKSKVIAKSLDCENVAELQAIYDDMDLEMARHAEKREADGLKLLNMLCQMTRARQHAELLKVPMMVELILDLLEEGHSVPVFVNYSETLEAIHARLKNPVSIVRGGQTKKVRDANVADFQNGSVRIILCQIQAGGESISLHDKDGRYPRASVISPGFDARAIIQACGRTPRATGRSQCLQYIVFARNTIEDAAYRCCARKSGNIELLNDGDLAAGLLPTWKK